MIFRQAFGRSTVPSTKGVREVFGLVTADRRRVRRIDAVVADALVVERGCRRPALPTWPDVDVRLEVRASSDSFVRVGGVDYPVPPRFARRRLSSRPKPHPWPNAPDDEQSEHPGSGM